MFVTTRIWFKRIHTYALTAFITGDRGERGTPYNGLYGEAPPEWGTFFRLQVYERVGSLLVEGKSAIWVCERVQRANR